MFDRIAPVDRAGSGVLAEPAVAPRQLGLFGLIILSGWCGLVAGLLEVATIVVRKGFFDDNHLYGISREFIWFVPAINLGLFIVMGLLGWLVILAWPRAGRWLVARLLCAGVLLPAILIAFPRIYSLAWLAVTLGIATRFVPILESNRPRFRRLVQGTIPVALTILLVLAASPWLSDRVKRSREMARPLPPPGSPSVLLIVLDTVAAGHLGLYGYGRPTSNTLVELAGHGIRFDAARSASSWTLPSHATMFTGRWMHELSVGWLNPLDGAQPTLAEYLGSKGYATAGFVANTMFCARDSGLARGFTHYEDYIFPEYTALKSAVLVHRALAVFGKLLPIVENHAALAWLRPHLQRAWQALVYDRKTAATVNREFLEWLSGRAAPERPFFGFLNYSDAHTPYELPDGRTHRFGAAPADERQRELIRRWGDLDKARVAGQDLPFVVDSYDDCIADLDEQVGRLLDRLRRRGVLDRTWVIVVSDHGESFGEHIGVFCHGTSLYQTEVHVPLVIIPPGGATASRTVTEAVSLRDLAATVVDVLGFAADSPLPGRSLACHWDESKGAAGAAGEALSEVLPGFAVNADAYGLPEKSWPLGAISDGDWSYIRGKGNKHEELYHVRQDSNEQRNVASDRTARPTLERMRQALDNLTGGPLVPERFSR